jgi:hypothetical protein
LIMLAWSVLEGALWLLPVSAVVSCFAWQSHLGYLPVAGFLLAVALVGFVVQVRANGRAGFRGQRPDERPGGGVRSHAGRIVLVTAAVLALCLAPLAYEQFTDHPGNLTRIVDSVRAPDAPTTGLRDALSVSAMHLTPVGSWSSGIEEREPLLGTVKGANPLALLVVAAGFGVGVWAGRRNRDGPALRLLFVTGGAAAVGVVAVTRTSSELFPYLFQWMRPVAMMLWLAVAWVLVRAAAEANEAVRSALDRFLAPVAAALVVALGVASLFVAGGMHVPEAQLSDVVGELSPTVLDVAGTEPIALRTEGNTCWSGVMIGLAVQLEKNGTPVSVTEDSRASFGPQRVDRPAGRQLRVVCGPEANAAAAGAGSTPVATFGLLDAAETAESADARRILADRLQLANRPDLVAAVQSPSPAFGDLSQILTVTGDDATVGRLASILQRQAKTIAVFIEDTPTHAGTEQ